MTNKSKFSEAFTELHCIGPNYLCPYSLSSPEPKRPCKVQFDRSLSSNEEGFLLYNVGETILDRYEVLSELGKGGCGLVLKVHDKERDEVVAFKALKKSEDCHQDGVREYLAFDLLKKLDPDGQQHFVKLLDGFCCSGHICLIFELLGPDLLKFVYKHSLTTFSLSEVRSIGKQLCDAIRFLHENSLTHNDIKPRNIAFADASLHTPKEVGSRPTNTEIRVIDLGSIKSTKETRIVATTCSYQPPESLLHMDSSFAYDVWAIGCTLFELYTGKLLFAPNKNIFHLAMIERLLGELPSHMTANDKIFKNGKVKLDGRTKFARSLKKDLKKLDQYRLNNDLLGETQFFELLKKMLAVDPRSRISAKEACQHEFFYFKKSKEKKSENENSPKKYFDGHCNCV